MNDNINNNGQEEENIVGQEVDNDIVNTQDIEDEIKESQKAIKDSASLAKNVATGNALGTAKDAIKITKNKKLRIKIIKRAIIKVLVAILIVILLGSALGAVFDAVGSAIQKFVSELKDFFNIDLSDGSINIQDEYIDSIINMIDEMGISAEDLGLLGEFDKFATSQQKQEELRKYIRKFYEAQVVTETLNYYHKESSDSKTYGSIYVYREQGENTNNTNNKIELTFEKYEKMKKWQEDNDTQALSHFSIDDSGNLVVAGMTITQEEGKKPITTITLRSINYKSAVSQYTTQMNFLVYLTMISDNPEFVSALVELIKDSRIEISIMDNVTTNVETKIYKYTEHNRKEYIREDDQGNEFKYYNNSMPETKEEKTTITTITKNPTFKITYIKTWFCEQKIIYKKTQKEPTESQYTITADENEDLKDEEAITGNNSGTWRTDKSETYQNTSYETLYEEELKGDVVFTVGEKGDSERYKNKEIDKPTFVGLMETKFKLPYSTREEAAGGNLISGAEMLFALLQKDPKLENMEIILRYAFNKYLGYDKYKVELDGSIFEIGDFVTVGGGLWSAIWDDSISREEFIDLVEAYVPPNATGNSGRSFRTCYNKYFVANAGNFYDICTRNGIDPRFIFCIGIHESAYGTSDIANQKGNFFGWGAYDSSPGESAVTFYDMSEGIKAVSSGLKDYVTPGTWQYKTIEQKGYNPTTIDGIGSLYASDSNWANAVKSYMTEIFGCTGIGENNGNIVAAAVSVHSYLRNNGYTYAQAGVNIPNTSSRTIDCSSYVTWVLLEAGIPGFTSGMYQWTSSTFASNPKGWQVVSINEAAPGDIVVYRGHVEIVAENSSGNKFRVYNCGGNESIMSQGTSGLPESSMSGYNKSQAIVILRVPI